jgi:hypothetical protein
MFFPKNVFVFDSPDNEDMASPVRVFKFPFERKGDADWRVVMACDKGRLIKINQFDRPIIAIGDPHGVENNFKDLTRGLPVVRHLKIKNISFVIQRGEMKGQRLCGEIGPKLACSGAARYVDKVGGGVRIPRGDFQRSVRIFSRGFGNVDRFASQIQINQQPDSANQSKPKRRHSPPCRITSGVCGFPLSAKIVSTTVLAWPAWLWFFRALDYFDGNGGRARNRWRSLWFGLASLIAFALIGAILGWTGG